MHDRHFILLSLLGFSLVALFIGVSVRSEQTPATASVTDVFEFAAEPVETNFFNEAENFDAWPTELPTEEIFPY